MVVCDSGPIIWFSEVECFDLLREVFRGVMMRRLGFRLSERVYQDILKRAEEDEL